MRKTLIILTTLALLGAGCVSSKPSAAPNPASGTPAAANPSSNGTPPGIVLQPAAEYGQSFTLNDGDSAVFPDGLQITLMHIGDSRCKPGVQCVWAGELSPTFSVMRLDKADAPTEITLGTTTKKEAKVLGKTFTLSGATEDSATLMVK